MRSEFKLRRLVIDIGKRMYEKGFVAAIDGNLSVRYNDGFLITPTGICKGDLQPHDLVHLSKDGSYSNDARPSSEFRMHIEIYKKRQGVQAIIHAHPPYATGFAIAGLSMEEFVLPEVLMTLGKVPLIRYMTPGTKKFAENVAKTIETFDAALLENHGIVSVGKDLWEAYYKLERVEYSCKVLSIAKTLGNIRTLSEPEIEELLRVASNPDRIKKIIMS